MSRLEFFVNHIERADSIFADISTRWSKSYRTGTVRTDREVALFKDITPTAENIVAVCIGEIRQLQFKQQHPAETRIDEDGVSMYNQDIWIPSEADEILVRIIVEAHCGERGQRAYKPTVDTIQRPYWWPSMKQDVKEFVQACIHCII